MSEHKVDAAKFNAAIVRLAKARNAIERRQIPADKVSDELFEVEKDIIGSIVEFQDNY